MHIEEAEPDVNTAVEVVYVQLTFGMLEVIIILQMTFSRHSMFFVMGMKGLIL